MSLSDEIVDYVEFELAVALARFVVADGNRTGAFIALGSLFIAITEPTEVPFLPGGVVVAPLAASSPCLEAIRRVGKHPSLDHLTDGALLAAAGCNVTTAFVSWPSTLNVLAVTRPAISSPSAAGQAIILAHGISVAVNVILSANSSLGLLGSTSSVLALLGDPVTVVATVKADGVLLVGAKVRLRVVQGLGHALPAAVATDANGQVQLIVSSLAVNESVFQASVELDGRLQPSNSVSVKWCTVPVVMPRKVYFPEHTNVWSAVNKEIVLKSDIEWKTMTTADFAWFSAVVLPDPKCNSGSTFLETNGSCHTNAQGLLSFA